MKSALSFLTVVAFLVFSASASADSGGATVSTLPESSSLEVRAEVQHECGSESICVWYGEAAAYAASSECPSTFDESHYVGSGSVENSAGSSSFRFAFSPGEFRGEVVICLYVNAEETNLVGQSHPFDITAGREVLPQPQRPPPRSPAKTTAWVTVRGCSVLPHVAVNGEKNIGGDITWTIYRQRGRKLIREGGERAPEAASFEAGEYPDGTYRFAARFLGDSNLRPSPKPASIIFHVKHC